MSRLKSFLARGVILPAALGGDSFTAEAHPGLGIVVDAQGNVFSTMVGYPAFENLAVMAK